MKDGNVAVVREYFNALRTGDMGKLGSIFADDIIWHQPGASHLSMTYHGKEKVFALFGTFMELSGGTFQIDDVEAIMSNGDLVSAILHFQAERSGETMSMKGVDLMRVENGLIKEVWLFSANPAAEDKFWGA